MAHKSAHAALAPPPDARFFFLSTIRRSSGAGCACYPKRGSVAAQPAGQQRNRPALVVFRLRLAPARRCAGRVAQGRRLNGALPRCGRDHTGRTAPSLYTYIYIYINAALIRKAMQMVAVTMTKHWPPVLNKPVLVFYYRVHE